MKIETQNQRANAIEFRDRLLKVLQLAEIRLNPAQLETLQEGLRHQIKEVEKDIFDYDHQVTKITSTFAWSMLGIKLESMEVRDQAVKAPSSKISFHQIRSFCSS
jgi:hypothetical protein